MTVAHRIRGVLAATCLAALIGVIAPLSVTPADSNTVETLGRCGTQIRFEQELRAMGFDPETAAACPEYGPCDDPETRDPWIPGPEVPVKTIRLAVHVVAHDDGSNPFATAEEILEAVEAVNLHYQGSHIRFEYTLDEIHSSDWRALSESEIDEMKTATAADPTQYLNVWITSVLFGYSFGTFPFAPNALEVTGGIVLGQGHWGGNHSGLAHEIGHCLGLWHNFHGVDEVTKCGPCYEAVDATDRDRLGDMCSDTPPAPAWYECGDPTGVDSCSGLSWGVTQPENIMGYTPIDCRALFTPQQGGRMRCWINDVLSGWVVVNQADCCIGRVGDANGIGGDEPTIGDVSVMIDARFILGRCEGVVPCVAEADVNQSGGPEPLCDDITIGDISTLIDYLFITGSGMGLPDCL